MTNLFDYMQTAYNQNGSMNPQSWAAPVQSQSDKDSQDTLDKLKKATVDALAQSSNMSGGSGGRGPINQALTSVGTAALGSALGGGAAAGGGGALAGILAAI